MIILSNSYRTIFVRGEDVLGIESGEKVDFLGLPLSITFRNGITKTFYYDKEDVRFAIFNKIEKETRES